MKKADFENEVTRIERNSHCFLKYFGVFWGTILIFIVQNQGRDEIASVIAAQIVEFFANPMGKVNLLGFLLLFLGVLLCLISLVLLSLLAVSISTYIPRDVKKEKYLGNANEVLLKSIKMGVFGSILLFLLFILALMRPHETLSAHANLLGEIFFWLVFAGMFVFDPLMLLKRKRFGGWMRRINFFVAMGIFTTFLWAKFATLNSYVAVAFVGVLFVYLPARLIVSAWYPFVFTEWLNEIMPEFKKS